MEPYKLSQFRAWTPWREINERGQHRPTYLTMFGLVPLILSLEQRRSKTARSQEGLSDLADDVQSDDPEPYIGWLKPSKWKWIDWDE
ncbi:unnamed protein product [Clonostachys byssicola]|uniref:Uncharacterized protein n=1 Tax=Clonostachys byssicola TaxID=160290 RepID=A0A9N9XYL5_9HYPO|nr:unnamed protein product [Clonostachys byssicola]